MKKKEEIIGNFRVNKSREHKIVIIKKGLGLNLKDSQKIIDTVMGIQKAYEKYAEAIIIKPKKHFTEMWIEIDIASVNKIKAQTI